MKQFQNLSFYVFLTSVVLSLSSCASSIKSFDVLDSHPELRPQAQQGFYLCWAASMEAIMYYQQMVNGHSPAPSQCELAFANMNPRLTGVSCSDRCLTDWRLDTYTNEAAVFGSGTFHIASSTLPHIKRTNDGIALSMDSIIIYLKNDGPYIFSVKYPGDFLIDNGGKHYLVVTGYMQIGSENCIIYWNPLPMDTDGCRDARCWLVDYGEYAAIPTITNPTTFTIFLDAENTPQGVYHNSDVYNFKPYVTP